MTEKIVCATDMVRDGTQYHIGLKKGELAENVILCGEIERVEKVASFLDSVKLRRSRREFITVTGQWKGLPISVMGTGIGPDNTEIALIESIRILQDSKNIDNAIFIRVGSCGALQKKIKLGDLVISTGSVRYENTSLFYVPEGYPAVADYRVVNALTESARKLGCKHHVGLTATTSSFYGAQCRRVGFPLREPGLLAYLMKLGVLNIEMETSLLFTLCTIAGIKSGAICTAYTDRTKDTVITPSEKNRADKDCIRTALGALKTLCR
jgi:uridine phosphorylase